MVNQLTIDAGLKLNVNTFRTNMKAYFEEQEIEVPKFNRSHVAVTAVVQEMHRFVLTQALEHVKKDKSGLRRVSRPVLKSAVLMNDHLKTYFYMHMRNYNPKESYQQKFVIPVKEMSSYVENTFGSKVVLTPKARGFLCFLLEKTYTDLVCTSYKLIDFASRKTLDGRSVRFAVELLFTEHLAHKLNTELVRAVTAVGNDDEEEVELDQEADDGDDGEEVEPDDDDGEDEGDDDGEGEEDADDEDPDDDDDGDEEEETVEVKPKAKGKGKGKAKVEVKPKGKGAAKSKGKARAAKK